MCVRDLAARCARGLQDRFAPFKKREGAGNAGCALHPRSHAQCIGRCAHEHTGQRRTSDTPCAMALRLITSSPRRTALLPPLRPEKQLPPGALTPAPRRQDHTSSPYASVPFVIGTYRVHRNPSHVRDDHEAPLLAGRDGCGYSPVRPSEKAKYFLFGGLTSNSVNRK